MLQYVHIVDSVLLKILLRKPVLQHVHIVDSVLLKIITMKTCVTASSKRFHTPRQLAVLKTFTTVCVKEAVIRVEIFSRWCFLRHSILSGPLGCSSWWSFLRPLLHQHHLHHPVCQHHRRHAHLCEEEVKKEPEKEILLRWGGSPSPAETNLSYQRFLQGVHHQALVSHQLFILIIFTIEVICPL